MYVCMYVIDLSLRFIASSVLSEICSTSEKLSL